MYSVACFKYFIFIYYQLLMQFIEINFIQLDLFASWLVCRNVRLYYSFYIICFIILEDACFFSFMIQNKWQAWFNFHLNMLYLGEKNLYLKMCLMKMDYIHVLYFWSLTYHWVFLFISYSQILHYRDLILGLVSHLVQFWVFYTKMHLSERWSFFFPHLRFP